MHGLDSKQCIAIFRIHGHQEHKQKTQFFFLFFEMALATTFLNPLDTSVAVNLHIKSKEVGNTWESVGFNKSANLKSKRHIHAKGLRVNCILQKQQQKLIDQKTTSLIEGITERAIAVPTLEKAASDASMSTVLVHYHNNFDPYLATSTPIYQTATFKMPSATHGGQYMYSRSANPTRDTLEQLVAQIDNAAYAYCFNSGMSALTAVTELVKPGEEIVAVQDIYGGSYQFLMEYIARKGGVEVNRIDTSNLENVQRALERGKTKLVWLESPSNPQLKISDLQKISDLAHEYGAVVLVDNSMMSPVLCKPLDHGVDIVMNSATKFISGNSNCMAGVLTTKDETLSDQLKFYKNAMGCALAPFDSWICLEGIKTMALRVERKQENAQKIAEYLKNHSQVTNVNYVGLPDAPGRDLHFSQASGAGSVLSFNTTSAALSQYIVENTEYFSMTVSFGSVSSAICLPWYTSHGSIPQAERESMGITEDLVRISVGIEDVNDLIADLENAFSTFPSKMSFWF